jgi:hypothetical protein
MVTEIDLIEADWAWQIYKQIEALQQLLAQKYHYEFLEMKHKEDLATELDESLPF